MSYKQNIAKLVAEVLNADSVGEFDMEHHKSCLIGCAARLDGYPNYQGDTYDYNANKLCHFVGLDPEQYDAKGRDVKDRLYMAGCHGNRPKLLSQVTATEAVQMLGYLADTGEVKWPWE